MVSGGRPDSDQFPAAFEAASARLAGEIEEACAAAESWVDGTAAAIHRALAFASADPDAAHLLTNGALERGAYGVAHYDGMLARFAEALRPGRALTPHGEDLPELLERSLVGGVASLIANRVESGRAAELPGIEAEVIQFVLTPYLGAEQARRVAAAPGAP